MAASAAVGPHRLKGSVLHFLRHHVGPPKVPLLPPLVTPLAATPTMAQAPPSSAAAAAITSDDITDAAEHEDDERASVEADQVRFVVRSHVALVRACYERALSHTETASTHGRVELGFRITVDGDHGRAADIHVESDTTGSSTLAPCLAARVAEWTFPRPVGGDYALTYPFLFAPGG